MPGFVSNAKTFWGGSPEHLASESILGADSVHCYVLWSSALCHFHLNVLFTFQHKEADLPPVSVSLFWLCSVPIWCLTLLHQDRINYVRLILLYLNDPHVKQLQQYQENYTVLKRKSTWEVAAVRFMASWGKNDVKWLYYEKYIWNISIFSKYDNLSPSSFSVLTRTLTLVVSSYFELSCVLYSWCQNFSSFKTHSE